MEQKKILPRHRGGAINLKGGTGPIIKMVGVTDFIEFYKVDKTFRGQTPENLDPEETVPDIPWVVSEIPDVGCGNPIVARVFIQTAEAIKDKTFKHTVNSKRLLESIHSCKEELIICETAFKKLLPEYEAILDKIRKRELEMDGKAINPFPQINSLDTNATLFLTSAKKSLQRIIDVFCEFYAAKITNPRFDKAKEFLRKHRPDLKNYLAFLDDTEKTVCNILDLRNYQEHPTKEKKTIISNFRLTPKGIRPPHWYVIGNPEAPIIETMREIIDFLIIFAEANFFFCITDNLGGWIPYCLIEIPEEKRNKDCPIRYQLEIDLSKLSLPK